jgi:glyoxalase superfamily protein
MDVTLRSIVIDCHDPRALAPFWMAVPGFREKWADDEWVQLEDPAGRQVNIAFQRVPEPKSGKNRLHLDLNVADEEAAAARIAELGGSRLWKSEDPDDVFIVLADPEGNEFCVVRDS